MKTLKFKHHFIEAILQKEKIITSRLFDDKNFVAGDKVSLLDSETGEEFAVGEITKIKEMPFAEMIKDAHDTTGMFDLYKDYHNRKINPDDMVKFIYLIFLKRKKKHK